MARVAQHEVDHRGQSCPDRIQQTLLRRPQRLGHFLHQLGGQLVIHGGEQLFPGFKRLIEIPLAESGTLTKRLDLGRRVASRAKDVNPGFDEPPTSFHGPFRGLHARVAAAQDRRGVVSRGACCWPGGMCGHTASLGDGAWGSGFPWQARLWGTQHVVLQIPQRLGHVAVHGHPGPFRVPQFKGTEDLFMHLNGV